MAILGTAYPSQDQVRCLGCWLPLKDVTTGWPAVPTLVFEKIEQEVDGLGPPS
jgi:hypothetical protein